MGSYRAPHVESRRRVKKQSKERSHRAKDGYSYWIESYLAKATDAAERASSSRGVLPPFEEPGRVYTDNSRKFIKACQDSQWTDDVNTPHRSENNGIAERTVRRVKKNEQR